MKRICVRSKLVRKRIRLNSDPSPCSASVKVERSSLLATVSSHLTWRSIFNSVIKPMIRNFNHGPRHWTSIEVLWKEFKIRAKVELDYTIWLIWKSIHWGSWVVATTIQILESNPLADPIFEERYLTSCTDDALFAHKVNNDPSDEKNTICILTL